MSVAFSFEHFISLPLVHKLKEALLAFFRASEVGAWEVDPTQRDDRAAMHLIRGNWELSDSPGGEMCENCGNAIKAELKSLAKYLKQSYHLPNAPEVSSQPAADPSCLV